MKKINTGKCQILVLGIKSGQKILKGTDGQVMHICLPLNPEEKGWIAVGLLDDLTEEECRRLLIPVTMMGNLFRHHTNSSFWCLSAKASLKTLLEAHGYEKTESIDLLICKKK